MRATMDTLVARLRRLTDAATTDEFNSVIYWSDDQLEAVLDQTVKEVDIELVSGTRYVNGAVEWQRKSWVYDDDGYGIEKEPDVVTADGYDVAYTSIDYNKKIVVVNVSEDEPMYLRCAIYDIWQAAYLVWKEKAEQRTDFVNWKVVNERVDMEQEYKHCVQSRDYYYGLRVKGFSWL